VVPGKGLRPPSSLRWVVKGTERGRAPYLEMVFSGLAAHVKDIQGTRTLHAANRAVDMQKDKPARQSTRGGKHSKDTPKASVTVRGAIPRGERASLSDWGVCPVLNTDAPRLSIFKAQ